MTDELKAALAREAALREELAIIKDECIDHVNLHKAWTKQRDDMQQRLTAAEQWNSELWKLVEFAYDHEEIDGAWVEDYRRLKLLEAKPTESGASE